jgi:Holliday junction resolvase
MINSKRKGKVGELEFAQFLCEAGFEARRGQQFSGGEDSADVVTNIAGIHFEVKRAERLNIDKAIEQAVADAPKSPVHCVAHRRNRKTWLATLPMSQFLEIYAKVLVMEAMSKP